MKNLQFLLKFSYFLESFYNFNLHWPVLYTIYVKQLLLYAFLNFVINFAQHFSVVDIWICLIITQYPFFGKPCLVQTNFFNQNFFVFVLHIWDILHCSSHDDCHNDLNCNRPYWDLSSTCAGFRDPSKDCTHGECVCVRGYYDFRCDGEANLFDLEDGGWCWEGRRDEFCVSSGKHIKLLIFFLLKKWKRYHTFKSYVANLFPKSSCTRVFFHVRNFKGIQSFGVKIGFKFLAANFVSNIYFLAKNCIFFSINSWLFFFLTPKAS